MRLALRSEATPIDQLVFEGGEETLAHRSIVGVADQASRWTNAVLLAASAEGDRLVLRTRPLRVQAALRVALSCSGLEARPALVQGSHCRRRRRADLTALVERPICFYAVTTEFAPTRLEHHKQAEKAGLLDRQVAESNERKNFSSNVQRSISQSKFSFERWTPKFD